MSLHHSFSVSPDNQFADANRITAKFDEKKLGSATDGRRNAHVLVVVLDVVVSTSRESAEQMRVRVLFQFQQVNWNCLLQTPRAVCPRALLNPIPRAVPSLCRWSPLATVIVTSAWNSPQPGSLVAFMQFLTSWEVLISTTHSVCLLKASC